MGVGADLFVAFMLVRAGTLEWIVALRESCSRPQTNEQAQDLRRSEDASGFGFRSRNRVFILPPAGSFSNVNYVLLG